MTGHWRTNPLVRACSPNAAAAMGQAVAPAGAVILGLSRSSFVCDKGAICPGSPYRCSDCRAGRRLRFAQLGFLARLQRAAIAFCARSFLALAVIRLAVWSPPLLPRQMGQ